MPNIDIVPDDRFTDVVADVVRKHFPDIKQYVPKIQGLVKTKTDKDENVVQGMFPPVVLKKTPPVYTACGMPPYMMVIDGSFWTSVPDHEIKGMIANALLGLEVQIATNKKGEDTVKFKSRKPDLVIFTESVRMFGAYTRGVIELREAVQGVANASLGFVRPEDDPGEEASQKPAKKPAPVKPKAVKPAPRPEPEPEDEQEERPRVKTAAEIAEEDAVPEPRD